MGSIRRGKCIHTERTFALKYFVLFLKIHTMETQEYEDGTVPQHVANFFRMQRKEQVARIIEQE